MSSIKKKKCANNLLRILKKTNLHLGKDKQCMQSIWIFKRIIAVSNPVIQKEVKKMGIGNESIYSNRARR